VRVPRRNEFDTFRTMAGWYRAAWGVSHQTWTWQVVRDLWNFDAGIPEQSCDFGRPECQSSCATDPDAPCDMTCPQEFIVRESRKALREGATYLQFEPAWASFELSRANNGYQKFANQSQSGAPRPVFNALAEALLNAEATLATSPEFASLDTSRTATTCNHGVAFDGNKPTYARWSGGCNGLIQVDGGVGVGCCELACGASAACDEPASEFETTTMSTCPSLSTSATIGFSASVPAELQVSTSTFALFPS
jgi:hypothetical protein